MHAAQQAEQGAFDALIAEIYGEVTEANAWPRALDRLRAALGAQTLVLQMAPAGMPERASFVAAGKRTAPGHIAEWEQRSRDQLISLALAPGHIDVCNDYHTRRPREGFIDLINRYDVARGMSTDLVGSGEARYSLHALRSARQAPFDQDETALMARIAPHFARAIGLRGALAAKHESGEFAAADRLGVGMFAIDATGFARAWNDRAAAVLGSGSLTIERGRLHAADLEGDRALQRALTAVVDGRAPLSGGLGVALADGLYAAVHAATFAEPVILRPRRGALVLVRAAVQDAAQLAGRLQELHGLTGAQAEIAAHLVSGHDARSIQARMGIRYSTLRTHITAMFAKLGCSRQTELVRLLTASLPLLN